MRNELLSRPDPVPGTRCNTLPWLTATSSPSASGDHGSSVRATRGNQDVLVQQVDAKTGDTDSRSRGLAGPAQQVQARGRVTPVLMSFLLCPWRNTTSPSV